MADPFKKLYDDISSRKAKPADYEPYHGGNGRIDRAVHLITQSPEAAHGYFPKGGTLLDIGGATGNLGYALREHYSRRITLDISDICRGPAEAKGNEFIHANTDVDGIPLPAESVDIIVALDVIEHLLNPEKFARECFRVLKPDGAVLVNTPNIQFWRHLKSLVCDGVFPHTSGDREVYHGGHVAFYNFHDLTNIFHGAGFHDGGRMQTEGLEYDPPPPIWKMLSQNERGFVGMGYSWQAAPVDRQLGYADLIYTVKK